MPPPKPKSSESCVDLNFKEVEVVAPSSLKLSFTRESKNDLLKNTQTDMEISDSKGQESKGKGNSRLQRGRGTPYYISRGVVLENKIDSSDYATGSTFGQETLHSLEERNPNCNCEDVGEQSSPISSEKASHSANKCVKFMETEIFIERNEQSGSAFHCDTDPYLTTDVKNDEHEMQIPENQLNNDVNKQGRMLMDYPTPKHSRYNQVIPLNRSRCHNRTQFADGRLVSQSRSSNQLGYGDRSSEPSTLYTADQKQENKEDKYESYRKSTENRRMTLGIRRRRSETWRSRISRLFHVMGDRLRKAFSRR
ncbi:hypothetical protein NPIL_318531 [Nephila pilipes]|uniref:Uncharacterized protein n=1 Tax=Nephila pilipes TaxID=299642 RepID=A0A8X6P354_NEPPI|nr:hypothetical protein NPIL_318531 [Nephila pilipes]